MPGFGTIAWTGLFFLYAPMITVILFSFNSSRLITVWEGFSFEWYKTALQNTDLHRATLNSLIVGIGATVASTLLALGVALGLPRLKNSALPADRAAKHSVHFLLLTPLLLPEIVVAVATLSLFSLISLNLGIGNVMLAHIAFCTPFAYAPIRARLEMIPPVLFQAGNDLYATPKQVFRYITLPLLMPGIVSGALLSFIISLDDFIITQLVAPPGAMTLPVYIYSMVRRGITPEINATSSLLLIVSIALIIASYAYSRKKIL
jgi:spermidine/putrescine transport system permease protein